MGTRTAVCPGSFDPITSGHLDVINRAVKLFDRVVVGVAEESQKKSLLPLETRVRLVNEAVAGEGPVAVGSFQGLLVDFARKSGATVIIKGLRAVSDFEHEFQMAQFNRRLAPEVETVFIMASPQFTFLSSSLVKEIAGYGGNIEGLVPPKVEEELGRFFGQQAP